MATRICRRLVVDGGCCCAAHSSFRLLVERFSNRVHIDLHWARSGSSSFARNHKFSAAAAFYLPVSILRGGS